MSVARAVLLHPDDDVLIAVTPVPAGTTVETAGHRVTVARDIAAGHKIAIRTRVAGDVVRRYGQPIGQASEEIRPGDHVHSHNLRELARDVGAGTSDGEAHRARFGGDRRLSPRTFQGYLRPDGRVGTRNYIAILSTVNCSATVSHRVRDRFADVSRDYPNVDGVIALTHKVGCGHVSGGEDHLMLERVLAGYARHPNVAAYVVIGLGCEVAQAAPMIERHRLSLLSRGDVQAPVITIQEAGGVRKAADAAIAAVEQLLPIANAAKRTTRPASDIVLATNCGGSDGYSGITANPALGWAFDAIIALGGTSLLAETPEIFGAERLLASRATSPAVAERLLARVAWWKDYLARHGVDFSGNPSPGNKAGGITTVIEKSLGGIAKAGTAPLAGVLEYGERIVDKGFVYMDTPGFDPVSVTGLVAGGANLVCFTTGRGSAFGCKPVPSIKLTSNSEVYRRMIDDMDIDCGPILNGASVEDIGRVILDEILSVASGKRTKSELEGVGEAEFAPWMRGPTL